MPSKDSNHISLINSLASVKLRQLLLQLEECGGSVSSLIVLLLPGIEEGAAVYPCPDINRDIVLLKEIIRQDLEVERELYNGGMMRSQDSEPRQNQQQPSKDNLCDVPSAGEGSKVT